MKQEFNEEGMEGLDSRIIFHILSIVMTSRKGIVTAEQLLDLLSHEVNTDLRLHATEKEKFQTAIKQGKRYFYMQLERFLLRKFAEQEEEFVERITQDYLNRDNRNDDEFLTVIHENFVRQNMTVQLKDLPEKVREYVCRKSIKLWVYKYGNLSDWYERKLLPKLSKKELQFQTNLEKIIKNYTHS